ncbi:MAG: iron chelate uptake ABC transporter family permease subunit, partial [Halanaerobium sp.]
MGEDKKNIIIYLTAVVFSLLLIFLALFIGSSQINPADILAYISGSASISASKAIIIGEIRLPRILLAFTVG